MKSVITCSSQLSTYAMPEDEGEEFSDEEQVLAAMQFQSADELGQPTAGPVAVYLFTEV